MPRCWAGVNKSRTHLALYSWILNIGLSFITSNTELKTMNSSISSSNHSLYVLLSRTNTKADNHTRDAFSVTETSTSKSYIQLTPRCKCTQCNNSPRIQYRSTQAYNMECEDWYTRNCMTQMELSIHVKDNTRLRRHPTIERTISLLIFQCQSSLI